jgi:hypothetical protein
MCAKQEGSSPDEQGDQHDDPTVQVYRIFPERDGDVCAEAEGVDAVLYLARQVVFDQVVESASRRYAEEEEPPSGEESPAFVPEDRSAMRAGKLRADDHQVQYNKYGAYRYPVDHGKPQRYVEKDDHGLDAAELAQPGQETGEPELFQQDGDDQQKGYEQERTLPASGGRHIKVFL